MQGFTVIMQSYTLAPSCTQHAYSCTDVRRSHHKTPPDALRRGFTKISQSNLS